ncbi:MAG: sigma-70 family RNA polymerase sigma factor [Rubrivivax sp.]|nr:sigma-70 family RNA polymerase sigma factor [Rubrivivax sp.]
MSPARDDDDAALVARCRGGDRSAWEALVRRYQRLVYAIARRSGLDEATAGDVFQTVFLRLIQHLPRLAEPARLQAWIVTTAKREAWLQHRRAERLLSLSAAAGADAAPDPEAEEQAIADPAAGPDEALAHWQQLAAVQRGLERLDERCRRLLQALFGAESAGYEEVAARLGVPLGSIGPTRARCLEKLRRSID